MEVVEGEATVADVDAFLDRLDAAADEHGAVVQAVDARYVVDRDHLALAVDLAGRARDRGEAIADDPAVEILLYAAGRRQIGRALEIGVAEGQCPVAVVVVGGDEAAAAEAIRSELTPAGTIGTGDRERIASFFEIGDRELAAARGDLADLVHERVAMLAVTK
ncbi:MAG: KEOPS complex subunit Cgi121 [Salinirussus sp.]